MRVAVVSDIHANLHALEAALAAIDAEPPDELWCLGDLVGYGPKPNECCALVQARAAVCLGGNHDLAVRGTIDLAEFSGDAAVAARWTQGVLTPAARAYLDRLEPVGERDGIALYHGSARDPVWEYVLSDDAAATTLALSPDPIVLVGHSHVALEVAWNGDTLTGGLARDGMEAPLRGRVLLNPGSVGQPRDGDPRAAYAIVDVEQRCVDLLRLTYAVEEAQAKVVKAGLPDVLAQRLGVGR